MASKTPNLRIRIRQNASVKEKTLIRVVAETLKKLVRLYQEKSAEEILSSFEIQVLRYKLKECLSRLMFLEPLEFGQKAEDTIWKSIFYEPIRIFKKELKSKPNLYTSKSMLLAGFKRHILGAIGYYQKLIMRLQTEYGFMGANYPEFGQIFDNDDKDHTKELSPGLSAWSSSCVQHCLMYIGDLYRYENDIKSPHSRSLAIRYYNLVLQLNPSFGHAYNQLATLDTLSYYGLNAAYYYLKAQLCVHSFGQAKDNLVILFERNVKRLRSVIDRESIMRKSGSNVSRGGLKVLRVKSSIIKYINLWHSFTTSADMDQHEAKQLALMCDDVLNNLSYVLGFDRKLVSESSAATGVRPSSLSCQIVSEILFIAYACLESMLQKGDEVEGDETSDAQIDLSMFDLAHTLTLNLYGHVFNQCLVRIRDEIRAANIDIAVLFRRYSNQETVTVTTEEEHEEDAVLATMAKPKRRKKTLTKRLTRMRHDTTEEQSIEDDLSEDETNMSENDNVLWDDQLSEDSSDSDNGRGFGFTESEDETEFESEEEIHSQDEDDQIIRAIVGSSTVFGRQQSTDKDAKKSRSKDSEKVMYSDNVMLDNSLETKRPKQRVSAPKDTSVQLPANVSTAPHCALVHCIHNIDLLQSLTVFTQSMHNMSKTTTDSFIRIWSSAPYLWKHFAVLLNFCENLLDDITYNCKTDNVHTCTHMDTDPRKVVRALLPEDQELKGSSLAIDNTDTSVTCDNVWHQVVSRLNRVIRCGLSVSAVPSGPLLVQKNGNGHTWLFSYSHNAPRANLVAKSWTNICNNVGIQAGNTNDKEKFMREMARLRLENELSSNSETEDTKDRGRSHSRSAVIGGGSGGGATSGCETTEMRRAAVYLIPDVNILCTRLDIVKALVRSQQFIVVIPQAVIQRLDRRKTTDHGARQVIKYLEAQMQQNNEHIKIEVAPVSPRVPDMACDLISDWCAIEASAVTLATAQSSLPSASSSSSSVSLVNDSIVVTILTDKAPQLPVQMIGHYGSLRVDFKTSKDL